MHTGYSRTHSEKNLSSRDLAVPEMAEDELSVLVDLVLSVIPGSGVELDVNNNSKWRCKMRGVHMSQKSSDPNR